MTFSVDSYLEYFLTLLAWIVNNGVFSLFVVTGIWLLPLIGVLLKTWRDVAKQGDDEGEKGQLLISWLTIELLPAMIVVVLTLAPLVTVSLQNLQFDVDRSKQCGYRVPLKPEETGYAPLIDTFGNRQARIPVWWMLMHKLNKGVNAAMISIVPCHRDLRQMRFEVQREKINDPNLITEIEYFTAQCYVPARTKLLATQLTLTPAQVRETSWLGGRLLVENSELYPRYRAKQPHKLFPYNEARDMGLPNTGNGGFPRCDEWWDDGQGGLKTRLLNDMRQNLSVQVGDFFARTQNRDEILLRALLRPENIEVSKGKAYIGYGGNLDTTFMNATARVGSLFGLSVGSLAAFPGLDAMRQSLPMVHSFMVMGFIILIPVITILSGYSLKTVVTLSFVYFALMTTPFWWELARWLDSFLLDIMYSSESHNSINPYFFDNTLDDIIINFVMGSMFLILPGIWFGSMSWAGVRMGELTNHLRQGSGSVENEGGGAVKKVIK